MVKAARFSTVLLSCALLQAGCVDLAAVQAEAERGVYTQRARGTVTLVPWLQIASVNLAARVDPSGSPLPGSGAGAPVRLVRPNAVAMRAGELYVADAGLGSVLHIVIGSGTANAIVAAPAQPGVRVQATGDRSLYLLDPPTRRVVRFSPSGSTLQTFAVPAGPVGLPVALAVDETRGVILLADATFNQLVVMPLLGGSVYPVIPRGTSARLSSLFGVASGADGFYAADLLCRCVTLFAPNGTVIASFGRESLVNPSAIAVDRDERIYVADRANRTLKIFAGGRQIAVFTAAQLGVTEITDLALDEGALAIADGAGGKIALLRVLATGQTTEPAQ